MLRSMLSNVAPCGGEKLDAQDPCVTHGAHALSLPTL